MNQNYNYKQTHKQKFTLSTHCKQALEVLKMDHSEIVKLLVESVQKNPFVNFQFHGDSESSIFDTICTTRTLQDDLYYQLHTSHYPYDDTICSFLIESIGTNGFLSYSEQEYCDILHVQLSDFQRNLHLIQSFEPCGVGAANQIEAMILQCKQNGNEHGAYMLTHHTQDIINKQFSTIAKSMKLSIGEVKECILSLRTCNPNPCASYETHSTQVSLPEVDILIQDQELLVQPVKSGTYTLNEEYLSAIKDNSLLKDYFQEATILFETIHKRNVTLLMIVNELVQIQKGYFLYQDELNPCTLKDIASKLGMSESTISRALSKKVYRFKGECYPFKKLFVSTNINGDSSDRIRKAILQLVKHEDKRYPLSDQQIVIKLSSMDMPTSRRTITKYREQLGILSSSKRKQS